MKEKQLWPESARDRPIYLPVYLVEWSIYPPPSLHEMLFATKTAITRRMHSVPHSPAPRFVVLFSLQSGGDDVCRELPLRVPSLHWRDRQTESGRLLLRRRSHMPRPCLYRRGGLPLIESKLVFHDFGWPVRSRCKQVEERLCNH